MIVYDTKGYTVVNLDSIQVQKGQEAIVVIAASSSLPISFVNRATCRAKVNSKTLLIIMFTYLFIYIY